MSEKPNLHALLRDKYPCPKFVFQFEVPNGTSYNKTRSCDAICIDCGAAVGIRIIGFEIKDSRSDWLKELQDPSKSQAWKQYCHSWYLVAQAGVAKLEELPPSWGLMEPAGNGLKIRKACEVQKPALMPLNVLAGLCRALKLGNSDEIQTEKRIREAYSNGYKAGRKDEEKSASRLLDKSQELSRENNALQTELTKFKSFLGLNVWSSQRERDARIEAFKSFVNLDYSRIQQLRERAEELAGLLQSVQRVSEQLKMEAAP